MSTDDKRKRPLRMSKDESEAPGAEVTRKIRLEARATLRKQAEARITLSPETVAAMTPVQMQKTLQELNVHQIELEMQNEELQRAQDDAEAAGVRYYRLYNSVPAGYFSFTKGGVIVEANLTASTMLGVARGALVNQALADFIVEEDKDIYYLHRKRLLESQPTDLTGEEHVGESHDCEVRLKKQDGGVFWAHLVETLAKEADGALLSHVVMTDISKRRRAEIALLASAARYKTILQIAMDGFWLADMQGHLMEVNETFCRMSGYSEAELLTMQIPDLEAVESAEDITVHIQKVMAQGADRFESRQRRKDGTLYDVEVSVQYRPVDGGRLVSFIRDITGRKRIEESLLKAEKRIKSGLDNLIEGCQIIGFDWHYLYLNDSAVRHGQLNREELLGRTMMEAFPGIEGTAMFATLKRCMEKRTAEKMENEFIYRDNSRRWFELSIQPVEEGIFILSIDITAQKQHEAEREKFADLLRQAQKLEAVGRLAGGVAHDFNNKLHIILSCVDEILKNSPLAPPVVADLYEIKTAAVRSAELTRQLLAFSRKQPISPVMMDLNEAIHDSMKMITRVIGENIKLNFTGTPELWQVLLDRGQLDQVLVNLAANARDAITQAGHISIEVANRTLCEAECTNQVDFVSPGDYVTLSFRDDGAGMSQELQSHIFEPFFTTKAVGKGTGLGLATVYGIVKQNHGAITVSSMPGVGTTFVIYLPSCGQATGDMTEETVSPIPTGTETVLVVEDDESVLHLARRHLAQQGYTVLTASTPRSAVQLCEQYPDSIHLLLSDVIMPAMGGRELSECIRKIRPDIRIMFMSGYPVDIMEQHGQLTPGICILHKPFTRAELAQHVRDVLDH
ncbi:MAG: PAS domain S-box protein [bacterium]